MSRVEGVLASFSVLVSAALLVAACSGGGGGSSPSPGPTAPSITTSALPSGQAGVPYTAELAAVGGKPPLAWKIASGSLPPGLSLDTITGTISGTPTSSGDSLVTFDVDDSDSPEQTDSISLTLTITGAQLTISTGSLPAGQVGTAYSATLQASGGSPPYTWSITNGSLPAGISLNPSGAISGTATVAVSNSAVTFLVTDSSNPAQTNSITLPVNFVLAGLTITTTSLPGGLIGSAYAASLTAIGGIAPLTWSLMSGTLPSGLTFDGSTGAITGVPTATASQAPLTFQVQDSSTPVQSKSVNLVINVSPASVSVAITPRTAGLTVGQSLALTATTNDNAGVTWSISPSGGAFQPATSLTGAKVTLTAPASGGVYTVTATSASDPSQSASIRIGVTGLGGVLTYHNDLARDGVNSQEIALTTANVNTGAFGKLFSCIADGAIYAQPLWISNLIVNGTKHNVVFVATEHDGLFAFDADASPCVALWSVSLIDSKHGGTSGEVTVPSGTSGNKVGNGGGDLSPEVGVTGTPVIDTSRSVLYVVSKSMSADATQFYQRLHAIDLATGNEKGTPLPIAATYPGTGDGGSTVAFNPQQQAQRPGLALVNGTVYIAWGSHEDADPYYGWVIGYTFNGSAFVQSSVLNVTPNVGYGAIWMSGGAPAADANNNLYVITANGAFDATSASKPNNDYGDSFLKLSTNLVIAQYFTPSDQAGDNANDLDFGAGGAAVLADLPAGSPVTHLVLGGGKDGSLYVLNRDAMGGYGDANAVQKIGMGSGIYATGALWNNYFYIAAIGGNLSAYQLNTSTAKFGTSPAMTSPGAFPFPGSTPSVSSSGSTNGIVWALDNSRYCTRKAPTCGPAVLHAYDAGNLSSELWNSSMASGGADVAGNAVKFAVPTIANGKVYVGTRGNNTGGVYGSTSASGELDVYGLQP
jgi:hypothetical protein